MIYVTVRPKSNAAIRERTNLPVVKLLLSIHGNVSGFIYEWEDKTRHVCGGITKNTILIMDNIEYDMGNDFDRKKFKEDFLVLNSLNCL